MSVIDDLCSLFGSQRALAEAVGVGTSAISMWRRSGIPDAAKWRLMKLARERSLPLDVDVLDEEQGHKDIRDHGPSIANVQHPDTYPSDSSIDEDTAGRAA